MSDLTVAFQEILEGDTELMALTTGGVLDVNEVGLDGGGVSSAPREADGVRLKPYLFVRWRAAREYEPFVIGAEIQTVEIYVYQDIGADIIDKVIRRLKALLHKTFIQAGDRQLAYALWVFTSGELPAGELGRASCKFARYNIIQV